METFALYLLKSVTWLSGFALVFFLFLKNERFFLLNRIYLLSKSEYSKSQLFGLMEGYFNNSFPAMASFFVREKDLTMKELEELLEDTRKELKKDKKKK